MAAAIMASLIDVARAAGTDNVELHATEQGRPLYDRLGMDRRSRSEPGLRESEPAIA